MTNQTILTQPFVEPSFHADCLESEPPAREAGIALCLCGGGYRAMLFHVGVLWRLNELKLLSQLGQISSVSTGSITAATLGVNWRLLNPDPAEPDRFDAASFNFAVVQPIRQLAGHTVDIGAVEWGKLSPLQSIGNEVAARYRYHLFGNKTLQDLPDAPRLVIVATDIDTGILWRFSKHDMAGSLLGMIRAREVPLAVAVAASAAFPPFLSAILMPLDPAAFDPSLGAAYGDPQFRREALLTDGGLCDHMALETAWNRFDTILISDGGRDTNMAAEPKPPTDWARHSARLIELLYRQISDLRNWQVAGAFQSKVRRGGLCAVQTAIGDYGLSDALECPAERTAELAATPTSLSSLSDDLQERLINWGYAACDAALRRHYCPAAPPPADFPYPRSGV